MSQGFFQALFDLSFRRFITLRLTGILYAIALALEPGRLRRVLGPGPFAPGGPGAFGLSPLLVRVAQNTSDILEELRKKP